MTVFETFLNRFLAKLPTGWFSTGPVLSGVAAAASDAAAFNQGQIDYASAQARVATATETFLDLVARDYFGDGRFPRRKGEADTSYRSRIMEELLRARGTRAAVIDAVQDLTGFPVKVFEPNNPADTAIYGGFYWGDGAQYGTDTKPYTFYVDCRRPLGAGIPFDQAYGAAYWGAGDYFYGSEAMLVTNITDDEIYRMVASVQPAGSKALVKISAGA